MHNDFKANNEQLQHRKILQLEPLVLQLNELKKSGKKIVFTNGCFDIIHPGHVDLLARARNMGDILVLGLNSDDSVRRQNKGPDRPINSFSSRAFVLAHLESVSFIVGFDEDTPLNIIQQIRPNILIKGGDWEPDKIVGKTDVEANGGTVMSLTLIDGYSTTALIKRIRSL